MEPPEIVLRLSRCLDTFDWTGAEAVCAALIERLNGATTPFPLDPARQILARLRRKCRFRLMERVSDALIRSGLSGAQIRRQYAQAMIDQGNLSAPEIVLNSILSDPQASAPEKAEAQGLLGRIYKQLYVDAHDPSNPRQQENLRKAVTYYYGVYRTAPERYLWQGTNAVALLARADRDHVTVPDDGEIRAIAERIASEITSQSEILCWDRAIMVEISVAGNRTAEAREHLIYFVADAAVDAFEVGSLFRQLTEVWELTPLSEPGASLLPLLRAAALAREGCDMSLNRDDVKGGLEAVFGQDRYEPFSWFQTGLQRCSAVARIENVTGRRIGSGFLVDACDFFEPAGDDPVLLTNAHVISPSDKPHPLSIPPEAAVAVFEASGERRRVIRHLWTSPVDELDATFVALEKMAPACAPCPLKPSPEPFDRERQHRVYVIGYPLGGGLSISLQDSVWLDTDDRLVHYRTPTEKGSSGSPVFDQDYWSVVALHHKGRSDLPRLNGIEGTYEANEGVAIGAIQRAVRGAAGRTAGA